MIDHYRIFRFFYFLVLIAAITLGGNACKSQKKIAAQKAQEARAINIGAAKKELLELLSGDSDKSLVEKERALARIKAMNLDDPEIQALIAKVEDKLKLEREAANESKMAETKATDRSTAVSARLEQHFDAIAQAGNVSSADSEINEVLSLFTSPDALVLIIINRTGSLKDYDKPTTIKKYLEYLKDQKTNYNIIDNLVFDGDGKIKEMELFKK